MNLSVPAGLYKTPDYTANSINVKDVSDMLDMWAHQDTPLLNRISWGEESGGLHATWIHEHLGWMYVETSAAISTASSVFLVASGVAGLSRAEQTKQIRVGTMLYAQAVADSAGESGDHCWLIVSTIGSSYSVTVSFMSSATASIAASTKLYIVGSFANEGSEPDRDTSRIRTELSNKMTILRKDIRITGSQMATDMYAVANELQHQTRMRLLELQFERERSILFSRTQTRSASATGNMNGMAELMRQNRSEAWVDTSTTSLTEPTFETVMESIVDNGGTPNVVVGSVANIAKFTQWESDRVRTRVDERLGGKYVTQYLSRTGVQMDLLACKKFPVEWLFILDTDQLKLRAKTGRKLLLQKLGLAGDYVEYQLLSEYTLEHRSVAQGYHGAFSALT